MFNIFNTLKFILLIIFSVTSFITFNLGMDSINFDRPYNPVLMLMLAVLFFLCACYVYHVDPPYTGVDSPDEAYKHIRED